MADNIQLIHGDGEKALQEYSDNYFDVAIVDVPYGIGEDGSKNESRAKMAKVKNNYGKKGWDTKPPFLEYFNELLRVSKNQIIWGANHFIENIKNSNSSCWIVWDKDNGNSDFSDCELAWTSFNTAIRKFKYKWLGMIQQNMKYKETRIHPTQKPVALYKWLLQNYTNEGDLILDTHGGSMSIAIACYYMNRKLIAYEIDEDYYNAALKRFKEQTAQKALW